MVAWHHRLDGRGFGWTPGVGDGQGGLACCGSWGRKESGMTDQLNWTELNWRLNKHWNTWIFEISQITDSFPGGSDHESTGSAGAAPCSSPSVVSDSLQPGFHFWLERSPTEGNGNPLQYTHLENPKDKELSGRLQSMVLQRVRHNWVTNTFTNNDWIKR